MRKFFFIIISCLVSLSCAANSTDNIKRWTTDEGMSVAYLNVPNKIVNINLAFNAGASRDNGKDGLAALTNNLVSSGGSDITLNEIDDAFDRSGSIFAATTRKDLAVLKLQSLADSKYLDPSLTTFFKIIGSPSVEPSDFNRVKNKQIYATKFRKQNPKEVAFDNFFAEVYAGQPYGSPTLGSEDTLEKITLQDTQDFYNSYYCRENGIIVIVGDVSLEKAEDIAIKVSKALPQGTKAKGLPKSPILPPVNKRIDFPVTQATLVLGKLGVTPKNKDLQALNIASSILGGGLDSRMMVDIREKQGLVYSAASFFIPLKLTGPFVIVTQTAAANDQKTKVSIEKVLSDFAKNGIHPLELSKAKNISKTNFFTIFTENSSIADSLVEQMFFELPDSYFSNFVSDLDKIDLTLVNDSIKKYMSLDNISTIIVGPNE